MYGRSAFIFTVRAILDESGRKLHRLTLIVMIRMIQRQASAHRAVRAAKDARSLTIARMKRVRMF